jgi:hypothetical protein
MAAGNMIGDIQASLDSEAERLEAEVQKLRKASAALAGGTPPRPARRPKRAKASSVKRGRPKGSGKRGQQAVKLVLDRPGITIPQLAKAMKIQPNYLYRVLPGLAADGLVQQVDKGWYPA